MNLRQLEHFLALADCLNFRRAAERLNMAQPPLSISIRKLEEDLGVRLFDRTQRHVELTGAGHAMIDHARRAVFHAAEAGRAAQAVARGDAGRLRIAYVGSAKYRLLPRFLPALRRDFPNITLELREENNQTILAMVEAGEIDLGMVRTPLAWKTALKLRALEADTFMVALPPGHRLADAPSLSIRDLEEEPFVQYSSGSVPGLHAMTMLLFQQAGYLPRVAQEAVQVQTVLHMVELGLGVALVPSASRISAAPGITFKALHDDIAIPEIGIAAAWRANFLSSAARSAIDLILFTGTDGQAKRD